VSFIRGIILAENVAFFVTYCKTAVKVFHINSHSYRWVPITSITFGSIQCRRRWNNYCNDQLF